MGRFYSVPAAAGLFSSPLNDAALVRDSILGALPDLKGGTLRIWGDWFGRPHDNYHRVTGATVDGESVTIGFDQGETLTVWRPAGCEIDAARFRILDADRVRWEWLAYGRLRETGTRYFLDYMRQGRVIRGESNVDWYTPAFQTDPSMPAVELV
jgi:hypothetical protein